jgi:hypothetical protein
MDPSLTWIFVTLYILVVDVNKTVTLIPLNSYFIMRDAWCVAMSVTRRQTIITVTGLLVFIID